MAIATRLSIYNGACALIGERILQPASAGATYSAEDRESRRALDDIWDRGGVNTCLAAGLWNLAKRTIQWNYDPDYTPPFGYQCAFGHPTDWVRWMAICVDPYMQAPLLQYDDQGGYLFCDLQQIYVAYVSNDKAFGMNMAAWPDAFQRYVEAYFAAAVCQRVTGDANKTVKCEKERDATLIKAKSTDAMNEATTLLPAGNWRMARHGRRQTYDRGNPYSLYN